MYSKQLLIKYIEQGIHRTGIGYQELAEKIDMPPSNLSRALKPGNNNQFTMEQFGRVIEVLKLTSNQVMHILTGSSKKEAFSDLMLQNMKAAMESFDINLMIQGPPPVLEKPKNAKEKKNEAVEQLSKQFVENHRRLEKRRLEKKLSPEIKKKRT